MYIDVECECGDSLGIKRIECFHDKVRLIIEKCGPCAEDNYKEGEADAQ